LTRARDVADSSLAHIKTETFSGASIVSLNNIFSSSYDNYLFISTLSGNAAAGLRWRLRSGGSDISTSTYAWAVQNQGWTSSIAIGGSASDTAGEIGRVQGTDKATFNAYIKSPFLSELTFVDFHYVDVSRYGFGGSYNTNNTSYSGLSFFATSGTISGVVKVYGYRD
jgi:hypothetical protein